MNELIKELAMKAGMVTFDDFASGGHFAEKFAELIVRECAARSYHMSRDSGPVTAGLIQVRIMSLIEGK